jgi:hypothetical protein
VVAVDLEGVGLERVVGRETQRGAQLESR